MSSMPLAHSAPASMPSRGKVGMICLIGMESWFFAGFIVAYLFYIGKSSTGPQPRDVLDLKPVLVNSAALIASSFTVVAALRKLARDEMGAFKFWMALTILLGGYFIYGTGVEWKGLIEDRHLTISTNLFGTTFYSLVGFHAFHVVVGLLMLTSILILSMLGHINVVRDHMRIELVSWYWHFVDVVWIFVFTTVYIVGMRP
ncbi:MAG: heme-copper oxidase subunit III [Planctomycetes bacterium]|nr:heme-copper oxidase subunit III [Planctomycetota bacterium]